jgi:hypothetical protein
MKWLYVLICETAELNIKAMFPNDYFQFSEFNYLLWFEGNIHTLAQRLDITNGRFGRAILLQFHASQGWGPIPMWQWINSRQLEAPEIVRLQALATNLSMQVAQAARVEPAILAELATTRAALKAEQQRHRDELAAEVEFQQLQQADTKIKELTADLKRLSKLFWEQNNKLYEAEDKLKTLEGIGRPFARITCRSGSIRTLNIPKVRGTISDESIFATHDPHAPARFLTDDPEQAARIESVVESAPHLEFLPDYGRRQAKS